MKQLKLKVVLRYLIELKLCMFFKHMDQIIHFFMLFLLWLVLKLKGDITDAFPDLTKTLNLKLVFYQTLFKRTHSNLVTVLAER